MQKDYNIGGLLLAAGGSSRLGHPKQLIEVRGKTLIRRAAETIVYTGIKPIVVVLGAEVERCTAELGGLEVSICNNQDWRDGIGGSIALGLAQLLSIAPDTKTVVITLCDQPYVNAHHLIRLLIKANNAGTPMAFAKYGEVAGVPAAFAAPMFEHLLALKGDRGARQLLNESQDNAQFVDINEAGFDIDLPEDEAKLRGL